MSELITPSTPKEELIMMKDDTSSSLDIEVEMEDNDWWHHHDIIVIFETFVLHVNFLAFQTAV